jgi:hypothetical protein
MIKLVYSKKWNNWAQVKGKTILAVGSARAKKLLASGKAKML